jgi:DNA-binding GntR family transcriptional regulator
MPSNDRQADIASSMSEVAYRGLRDRIVRADILPGAPLDEELLRDELGVGLTPIRDAIKRLSFERLVVVYPRRGTFAAEINIGDERWLTEIRLAVEGLAAALAAQRATDKERRDLLDIATRVRTAKSGVGITDVDADFHRAMFAAAHNPFLEPTLHQYFNLALRIWYFCRGRFQAEADRGQNHLAIAKAIMAGNPDAADQAARAHIERSALAVRRMLHAEAT